MRGIKAESQYYPKFDYLRIVLALTVLISHTGYLGFWDQSGNYPVQVFFSLSGWLIGGILLRSNSSDLPRFYFNRAARIWIPYFVAIALLIAASLLKDRITQKWLEIFFYDLTFVYNFFGPPQLAEFGRAMPLEGTGNHFWSICAEEQFYLLAPFLLTLTGRIGRSIWFWAVVSALALYSTYWIFLGSISLGVLAAVSRTSFGDWQSATAARCILLAVFIIVLAGTLFDYIPYRMGGPVSAIAIVLFLAQTGNHSAFGALLGGISFPLYLNQWIGVFMSNAILGRVGLRDTLVSHIVGIVLSVVVAVILYFVVDSNVRSRRNKAFSVLRGRVVAVCGFALVAIGFAGGLVITGWRM
jgi:peptidoglycan/LPS O-acetylase OafA/YrhL